MRYLLNFFLSAMVLGGCVGVLGQNRTYNLGRTPSQEEIRSWDIAIGPSGKELPPGSGTALEGEKIYAEKCASCHGENGTKDAPGANHHPLVGGKGTLNTLNPVRSIGSFWPYATTVYDYIYRAMPANQGETLSPNEVYALTAVLLYWNGIIKETDVIDAKSLPKVQMPNRNGFLPPVPLPERQWNRRTYRRYGLYP
jgi:S-disulfanyl-L-cysteine oxidoreductase SoxD